MELTFKRYSYQYQYWYWYRSEYKVFGIVLTPDISNILTLVNTQSTNTVDAMGNKELSGFKVRNQIMTKCLTSCSSRQQTKWSFVNVACDVNITAVKFIQKKQKCN